MGGKMDHLSIVMAHGHLTKEPSSAAQNLEKINPPASWFDRCWPCRAEEKKGKIKRKTSIRCHNKIRVHEHTYCEEEEEKRKDLATRSHAFYCYESGWETARSVGRRWPVSLVAMKVSKISHTPTQKKKKTKDGDE